MLWDSTKYDKLDVSGVKTALEKGANPNRTSNGACSAIGDLAFESIGWRYGPVDKPEQKAVEILQMLVKAGAKLQPCDQELLYSPVASGWVLFTEALLKIGASATREIEGKTPMEVAVQHGQANIIELLKELGVPALEPREAAQQALIGAAQHHDIPRIEEAIQNGANVNWTNRQGEIALVEACNLASGDVEEIATIRYLIKKGADPTIQGADGYHGTTTVLHCVMLGSWSTIIDTLLQHGAFISARDSEGRTPLHIAAQRNNIVGAKMLIEAGSKIMPKDDKGKTPLDYAESAEMIKLLKDHGAKE